MSYTFTLDGFSLPSSNLEDHWSGINKPKRRSDIRTFGGNLSIVWDFAIADVQVEHKWDWMRGSDFDTLRSKFETSASATYVYTVQSTSLSTYVVEIVGLTGTPFQDYYRDVTLTLKILEEV